MNIVKKLSVFILAFILLGGSAMAATVTLTPSTVPVGAYVNGSDGDQHFVQSLVFTIEDNGAGGWADGDDIIITLPTSMTIADVDEDGIYLDEVSTARTAAADVGAVTCAVATSTSMTLNIATASAMAGLSRWPFWSFFSCFLTGVLRPISGNS